MAALGVSRSRRADRFGYRLALEDLMKALRILVALGFALAASPLSAAQENPAGEQPPAQKQKPAANVQDKGGVKPAINQGEQAGKGSDIHAMEIFNGSNRMVFHFAGGSLPKAEQAKLREIDAAAADVAEKRMALQSIKQSLQDSGSDGGVRVVQPAVIQSNLPYWAYPFYDYYAPGGYPVPYYYGYGYGGYGWGGYGWGGGYGPGYGYGAGYAYAPAAASPTVVVQTSGGNGASRAEMMKGLNEARTALANAEKHYATVQGSAVYGPGGRIIGVRAPD
jgi:hypothetical protein